MDNNMFRFKEYRNYLKSRRDYYKNLYESDVKKYKSLSYKILSFFIGDYISKDNTRAYMFFESQMLEADKYDFTQNLNQWKQELNEKV